MKNDYRRHLWALNDDQLETFMLTWVKTTIGKDYLRCERFSGPNDGGLDVVGFTTVQGFEGPWDNYQCKQLNKPVEPAMVFIELGKMFYHVARKDYTLPRTYYFVAPRNFGRTLMTLFNQPERLKSELISRWSTQVADRIVENESIPLTKDILALIQAFDFSNIRRMGADEILDPQRSWRACVLHFEAEQQPAPKGIVPEAIHQNEQPYIGQLIRAYAIEDGASYVEFSDLPEQSRFRRHLQDQRQRFYDSETFKAHFRDSTLPGVLEKVEDDVYHGVSDLCIVANDATPLNLLSRVLQAAGTMHISGPLTAYIHAPVKQGFCHHLANNGRLSWHQT